MPQADLPPEAVELLLAIEGDNFAFYPDEGLRELLHNRGLVKVTMAKFNEDGPVYLFVITDAGRKYLNDHKGDHD